MVDVLACKFRGEHSNTLIWPAGAPKSFRLTGVFCSRVDSKSGGLAQHQDYLSWRRRRRPRPRPLTFPMLSRHKMLRMSVAYSTSTLTECRRTHVRTPLKMFPTSTSCEDASIKQQTVASHIVRGEICMHAVGLGIGVRRLAKDATRQESSPQSRPHRCSQAYEQSSAYCSEANDKADD